MSPSLEKCTGTSVCYSGRCTHTQPGKINTTSALPTPPSEHWSRHMLKGMLSSLWREVSKVQASMC